MKKGFDSSTLRVIQHSDDDKTKLAKLQQAAKQLQLVPNTAINMKEYSRLLGRLFSENGLFAPFIRIVIDNHKEKLPDVIRFVDDYITTDNDNNSRELSDERIEKDLNKRFQDEFTGIHANYRGEIKYIAKNQVMQHIKKRLELLLDWAELQHKNGKSTSREIMIVRKTQASLLQHCKSAITEIIALSKDGQRSADGA